jgi:glutamine amidotransferase
MGWSDISIKTSSKIFENFYSDPRFYFVHSYHLSCNNDVDVLCTADYGYEFVAGVERENIIGVQFHPEKSHKFGMALLKNFAEKY